MLEGKTPTDSKPSASGFESERRKSEATELSAERASETAEANGAKLLSTMSLHNSTLRTNYIGPSLNA